MDYGKYVSYWHHLSWALIWGCQNSRCVQPAQTCWCVTFETWGRPQFMIILAGLIFLSWVLGRCYVQEFWNLPAQGRASLHMPSGKGRWNFLVNCWYSPWSYLIATLSSPKDHCSMTFVQLKYALSFQASNNSKRYYAGLFVRFTHHVVDKPNCPNSSPQKLRQYRQYLVPPNIPVHIMHMTIRHITFLIGCVICDVYIYVHTHTHPSGFATYFPFAAFALRQSQMAMDNRY